MKTNSLHFKINFAIFITCLTISIVFCAILYPFESRRYDSHVKKIELLLDTVIQQKYEDIANELLPAPAPVHAELINSIFGRHNGNIRDCLWQLYDIWAEKGKLN